MHTRGAPVWYLHLEEGKAFEPCCYIAPLLLCKEPSPAWRKERMQGLGMTLRLSLKKVFSPVKNCNLSSCQSSLDFLLLFAQIYTPNHRLLIHHSSRQRWNNEPLYSFQAYFFAFCFTVPVTALSSSFIFTNSMSKTKSISARVGSLSSLVLLSWPDQCLQTEKMLEMYVPGKERGDGETGRRHLFKAYCYSSFLFSWSELFSFYSIDLSP